MNLKRWAEGQGVFYATARRWFESGELPVLGRRAGRRDGFARFGAEWAKAAKREAM